jgi:hypothetical protein
LLALSSEWKASQTTQVRLWMVTIVDQTSHIIYARALTIYWLYLTIPWKH